MLKKSLASDVEYLQEQQVQQLILASSSGHIRTQVGRTHPAAAQSCSACGVVLRWLLRYGPTGVKPMTVCGHCRPGVNQEQDQASKSGVHVWRAGQLSCAPGVLAHSARNAMKGWCTNKVWFC